MITQRVEIPSKMRSVRSLSTRVRDALLEAGISQLTAAEMELCVAECANNIIEHGHHFDPKYRVQIDLAVDGELIRLEVRDWAPPFDPTEHHGSQVAVEPRDLHEYRERGMGLGVIRALTDDITYQAGDDGNCTTLLRKDRKERD